MNEVSDPKNNERYKKHFHQTGLTNNPKVFLSQILSNLRLDFPFQN